MEIKSGHFLLIIAEFLKNLWHLEDLNLSVRHYLKQNNILYIIYFLVKLNKAKLPNF